MSDDIGRVHIEEPTAAELIEAFDIEPYILADGTLGIHFFNLSESVPSSETIANQVACEIEAFMPLPFGEEGRECLLKLRQTFASAIVQIDQAILVSDSLK